MRKYLILVFFVCISGSATAQDVSPVTGRTIQYFGKEHFLIEGTAVAEIEKESPYDRLPLSYREKVRSPVWDLSKESAGISVRLLAATSLLMVKWELLNDFKMNHMAETGIKGVDLYCRIDGKWRYINTGRPKGKKNEALLVENMSRELREYKMFLPLYDGITKLEIGVDSVGTIERPVKGISRPIVFYGTSITQGGCASRPGMAYTNIISRKLDRECINLGFSGNGRMEAPIAELMAGIDASLYVIDCVSNSTVQVVRDSTIAIVDILRGRHPDTPIVLVEGMMYAKTALDESARKEMIAKNAALKDEFRKMTAKGYTGVFYIDNKDALGTDNEGTVDGVHFTDLGFMRFADYLLSKFEQFQLLSPSAR